MAVDAPRMRVLAFEPFDSGSHRAVRASISRHSRFDWTWCTRPGRAWKWRMRLAAVELADAAAAAGHLERRPDVIVATSLLNVGDLIAALPRALRDVPVALIMHENQVAYPTGHELEHAAERDVQFALTNLTSVLTADRVIWNSAWNRRSFVQGIEDLLRHAPDTTLRDVGPRIEARSTVIWPPVEPPPGTTVLHNRAGGDNSGPVRVAWPHRWEHDKGPGELLELALAHSETHDLRWTILGEQFRTEPPEFAVLKEKLGDRIDHIGFEPDRAEYWSKLAACDWVLSTATHEFFGIAVVEAMLAGCLPWLPDRLSYTELSPAGTHGMSPMAPPEDSAGMRAVVARHLAPAVAPEAVRRIDDALAGLVRSRR